MKCINCQTENKDTAKFCRGCGSVLGVVEAIQSVEMKTCQECQHDCKPEAKFCSKCGRYFAVTVMSPDIQPVVVVAPSPAETKVDDQPAEVATLCTKCASPLKLNAKFCGKCGHGFVQAAAMR